MKKALVLAAALLAGTAGADDYSADLIKKLASPHHPTREAAHKALSTKTDQDTTDKLIQAMNSSDPEVARRAEILLKPYLDQRKEQAIQDEIQRITEECGGLLPQGDLAGVSYEVFGRYFEKAEGTTSDPHWSKYRDATRLMILDCLKNGNDPRPFIEAAKQGENRWWKGRSNRATTYSIPYPPKK